MEKAQKMVDEAAKAAGYNEVVFHGMGNRHNIYKSGSGQYGKGVYFTYSKDIGRGYGSVVDRLYVKIGRIADYDDAYKALGKGDDQTLDEFAQDLGFSGFDEMIDDWDNDPTDVASNPELIDILRSKGFEGFVDDGNSGFVLWDFDGIEYRIKLADPVTYDDNGNVIPLSERFNRDNPDIRFSIKDSSDEKAASKLVKMGDETATYSVDGKQYSVKSMKTDLHEGKMFDDLVTAGVFTRKESDKLISYLDTMYSYLANESNPVWEEVISMARQTAGKVVKESVAVDEELYNLYTSLRDYLKKQRLTLSYEFIYHELFDYS